MSDLVENYLACFNETDEQARRDLIARHWSERPTFTDPLADLRGRDAVADMIGTMQREFPGHVVSLIGTPDAHHNIVRFAWGLGQPGAEPIVVGWDCVVTDADGRIDLVLGFLDRVPG